MLKIVRLTFGFVALMLNLELNRYFLQKTQKRVAPKSNLSIIRLHQHGERRSIAANHELVESSKTEF